jgi:putative endonuclease
MITVYVLKSLRDGIRYIGITKDLEDRLKRHNAKRSYSTKIHAPFEVIYKEKAPDYKVARVREKFLKSGIGRKFLDSLES